MPTNRNAAGEERREVLLERIVDHVLLHGITGLTLRGIASAVGSNNRMLIYYFGSAQQLIVTALVAAGDRFSDTFRSLGDGAKPAAPSGAEAVSELLRDQDKSFATRLDQLWTAFADPTQQAFIRLFFGVLGLAAYDRENYAGFLHNVSFSWVDDLSAAIAAEGVEDEEAKLLAYELLAQLRGLQVLQVASEDFGLVDAVRRRWVQATTERIARSSGSQHSAPGLGEA